MAAVSLATQFQFLFSLFTAALTLGMSIRLWRSIGVPATVYAVERVLGFVMLYAGMLSTAFFLAALLVPEQLMSIMTNDGTLIMLGARYLRISSLSYLFIGLSQMYLCLMKNTGSAVMGMTVSTVGVIVHVVLNAALIYGIGSLGIPALGIFGAAISTVISRAIELAWSVVATRRGPYLRLGHVLHPDGPLQKEFLEIQPAGAWQ